jgi:hypothetical protein
MLMLRVAAVIGGAAFAGIAYAQCEEVVPGQYIGTEFANNLAVTHRNSEKAWFKIRDPSGQHVCVDDPLSDLSFLTYQSLNTTGGRPPNADLRRAVIVIHGARADTQNYHAGMLLALDAVDDEEISFDTVAVTAPYFPNDDNAGTGFPYSPDGATPEERYPSPALAWYGSQWVGGANNQYPPNRQTVSAFDALDQLIQYYANKYVFPNINQIVVSGHSMGAQMVHRYAAVGKTTSQLGINTPVSYWPGDPNSYVWFSSDRPLATGKCPNIFNNWREGLGRYVEFGSEHSTPMTYNTELVAAGAEAVLANYNSKTVAHARATLDKGDHSEDCSPYTTGQDRNERFFEFVRRFPPSCPDPAADGCHTVDIVVSRHDAPTMFRAPAGQARLFKDNWDGDGARAYDFGYPRHREGDDPFPDPAQADAPLIHTDRTVYAGGKTHRGCFSDVDPAQSVGSLPVVGYVGALNSREYCSDVCTQRGYAIAGVSWQHCYCGNALGRQTINVVTTSCEGPCPANSTAICGGRSRLSVFSSVDV